MRIITDNDKRGLTKALRVFVRNTGGERIPAREAAALVDEALAEGLTVDEILNRRNWIRAAGLMSGMGASDYIETLCDRRVTVTALKDEPGWQEPANGWRTVAEAAHDYYKEVTGKGGKWNVPSALRSLAKAVGAHSLQAVLSEALIAAVAGDGEPVSYFDYVSALARDPGALPVVDDPTEATAARLDSERGEDGPVQAVGEIPEDIPFPEPCQMMENVSLLVPDPTNVKRESVAAALAGYNLQEITELARAIPGDDNPTLSEIIESLTNGSLDPSLESPVAQDTHMNINGDLVQPFVTCARTQGYDMNDDDAARYDLLCDSWDLRSADTRKLLKLKRLILQYGASDPDLLDARADIERLYTDR